MRKTLISFGFVILPSIIYGQGNSAPAFEYHRFYLKEPAKQLIEIRYDDSCEPVDGKLMPDGKSILIRNYAGFKRLYLKILKSDGQEDVLFQSPCYIDPVIGEL